jgi:hypothetical protein
MPRNTEHVIDEGAGEIDTRESGNYVIDRIEVDVGEVHDTDSETSSTTSENPNRRIDETQANITKLQNNEEDLRATASEQAQTIVTLTGMLTALTTRLEKLEQENKAESKNIKESTCAFADCIKLYDQKYPKAAECLFKDRENLLSFYAFPAQYWDHRRASNPIKSMFATVKLRAAKTRGCLSRKTGLAMVYKLAMCAEKKWPRLRGSELVADIIKGVQFKDGEKVAKEEVEHVV